MLRKAKSGFRLIFGRLRRFIETIVITHSRSYSRVKPPPADEGVWSDIWNDESPVSRLLAANRSAVDNAGRMLQYEFRIFSTDIKFKSGAVQWNQDIFSGYSYPEVPYVAISIEQNRGRDIIVPWELSRLLFIPTLIQAHRQTGDDRYSDFFFRIVDDWIEANPYLIGVNWMTDMDVAIRGMNLALGISYFSRCNASKLELYLRVLWAHAEYIYERDIEKPASVRNNHFLIAIAGLLVISLMFDGERARLYFDSAADHFDREIVRQFREDGGNFESATGYHKLSLEAALAGLCFLRAAGPGRQAAEGDRPGTGKAAVALIEKGVQLVSDYHGVLGRSPQFGDSSDGRILVYSNYYSWDALDHSYIFEIADAALPGARTPRGGPVTRIYEMSGIGLYSNQIYGICLNAGPVEEGDYGGHNHCDKTSFVLQAAGLPLFIDSGTCCYTSDFQKRFFHKKTTAHNVLVVDGHEQAEIEPGDVFGFPGGLETNIRFSDSADPKEWRMEHNGYSRFAGIGTVARKIRCFEKMVEIEEEIEGEGDHLIEIVFNLHPGISFEIERAAVRLIHGGDTIAILNAPEGFEIHPAESFYSHHYTARTGNRSIHLSRLMQLPARIPYSVTF